MRLINPGAGEISDRLTILSLKLLFGAELGRDLTAFRTERTALLSQIRSRTLNGAWFDSVLELATVNAALWHAEDDLRTLRADWEQAPVKRTLLVADLAFRIQSLNDQRAVLIDKINAACGEGATGEKLFAAVGKEGA